MIEHSLEVWKKSEQVNNKTPEDMDIFYTK